MNTVFTLPIASFEVAIPAVVLGILIGSTYGLLAAGLVLVFRTSRVVNFAHGDIGILAAAFFGLAVARGGVPYWIAFPFALALGAGVAALAEVIVVRRLRNAPKVMSIVATLGFGQFIALFSQTVNASVAQGTAYPLPAFLPTFNVGPLKVTQAYSAMLFLSPVLIGAVALFIKRSRFGMAIRSASSNADAARLAGINVGRMSTLAWGIAGAIAAFTVILFVPTQGFVSVTGSFGPTILLRALVGAVIANMTSLPIALSAGVGLGVVEQLLLWNYPRGGLVEAALFVIILGALLLRRRAASGREEEKGSWAAVQPWPPLTEALLRVRSVRYLPAIMGAIGLAAAIVAGLVTSNAIAVKLATIAAFTIVGISVGIVTGLGGQLTFGQFAIASIGAVVSYAVSNQTGSFPLAFVLAGIAAGGASLVIGVPALRIKGTMLTVTTLSFALVVPAWLLSQDWMLGSGVAPSRPELFGASLESGRSYYFFALAVLVVVFFVARNVRSSGIGRRLVGVRDNEDNARAFSVRATDVKLQAFMLAGFAAGIGGAVYGHLLSRLSDSAFPVSASIDVAVMTVLGGIGLLSGPLIGALFVIGVPSFVPLDSAGLAASKIGALVLILYAPGGIAQMVKPIRDRVIGWLARSRSTDDVAPVEDEPAIPSITSRRRSEIPDAMQRVRPGELILAGYGVSKSYGGIAAVDDVTIEVRRGEIVGIIGPNGAGKTTLFEILGGFNTPDDGIVAYAGYNVTGTSAERRAELGLIRSFQDAALFQTMTVLDAVRLSLERIDPTRLTPSLLGLPGPEKRKDATARDIVATMGLDDYRNKQIRELSTGTRRITELACLVALEPVVLLLDEPASGIAQRETEALGGLLRDLKESLDLTLVVIEHDIPMIMGLADRIVAMDAGAVVTSGKPAAVQRNPRVVESYLGGKLEAIYRSGAAPPAGANGVRRRPARARS
jgi:ABC-type branched-subunit amino acid transport system ATPase component/ABC-type branched-subunit amino acid transport system permease subunit